MKKIKTKKGVPQGTPFLLKRYRLPNHDHALGGGVAYLHQVDTGDRQAELDGISSVQLTIHHTTVDVVDVDIAAFGTIDIDGAVGTVDGHVLDANSLIVSRSAQNVYCFDTECLLF